MNGTGKSSLTGVLKAKTADLGLIIDVDKLTVSMSGDKYAAGKKAVEKIRECLDKGYSFTQESPLSGVRGEATAKTAKERGYYIRLYYTVLRTVWKESKTGCAVVDTIFQKKPLENVFPVVLMHF